MSRDKLLDNLSLALVGAGLLAACFTPPDLIFTRLENLLVPFIFLVIAANRSIKVELPYMIALTGFFGFYIASIFINGDGMAEVSYAFRTLKIIPFLIMTSIIAYKCTNSLDKILKGTFVGITLITVLEYFNPMGVYSILFPYFTHHTMDQFQELGTTRIIGTMMNPNDNGTLVTCFIAYFMSAYYYSKRKINFAFIAVGFVLIFISQSRTSLIAALAMGIPFLLTFPITKRMVLAVLGSLGLVVGIMYLLDLKYMMELLSTNPLEISSFKARLPDWGYMLDVWREHKIWGVGPFTDTFTKAGFFAPDSEYIYIMGSRGLVGLTCYLAILSYPAVLFWIKRKEVEHGLLAVMISVAFALIGIANFTLLNVRIGVVYAILMGIPFSYLLFKLQSGKFNITIPSLGSLFSKRA